MRPRFKPNIPAKSTRKSSTSKSTKEENTESSAKIPTNEDENAPFIPPNSSKTNVNNVCEEEPTIEGNVSLFLVRKHVQICIF